MDGGLLAEGPRVSSDRQISNPAERFKEAMQYGMISYVVPLSLYPQGYLRDPSQPLPFIALASQKQYVSLYHMGLYAGPLLSWFKAAWRRHTTARLDLGKVCLRLRNLEDIPYDLVGELAGRMTARQWIAIYETAQASRQPSRPRRES